MQLCHVSGDEQGFFMGDDRPTRSASMGDPSAKCHNDDKKEKERKCEEAKEKGIPLCCVHTNHEASSTRVGHIVAQVLSW